MRKILVSLQYTYARHTARGPQFDDPNRVALPRRTTNYPYLVAEIRFASI